MRSPHESQFCKKNPDHERAMVNAYISSESKTPTLWKENENNVSESWPPKIGTNFPTLVNSVRLQEGLGYDAKEYKWLQLTFSCHHYLNRRMIAIFTIHYYGVAGNMVKIILIGDCNWFATTGFHLAFHNHPLQVVSPIRARHHQAKLVTFNLRLGTVSWSQWPARSLCFRSCCWGLELLQDLSVREDIRWKKSFTFGHCPN